MPKQEKHTVYLSLLALILLVFASLGTRLWLEWRLFPTEPAAARLSFGQVDSLRLRPERANVARGH